MNAHEEGYQAGKKVRSELESFLPEWGNTICRIIDFFFTRKEKHIVVVTNQMNTHLDNMILQFAEKAPTMAGSIAKAAVASMKEIDAVKAQHEAEKAAETEQPN